MIDGGGRKVLATKIDAVLVTASFTDVFAPARKLTRQADILKVELVVAIDVLPIS